MGYPQIVVVLPLPRKCQFFSVGGECQIVLETRSASERRQPGRRAQRGTRGEHPESANRKGEHRGSSRPNQERILTSGLGGSESRLGCGLPDVVSRCNRFRSARRSAAV